MKRSKTSKISRRTFSNTPAKRTQPSHPTPPQSAGPITSQL